MQCERSNIQQCDSSKKLENPETNVQEDMSWDITWYALIALLLLEPDPDRGREGIAVHQNTHRAPGPTLCGTLRGLDPIRTHEACVVVVVFGVPSWAFRSPSNRSRTSLLPVLRVENSIWESL